MSFYVNSNYQRSLAQRESKARIPKSRNFTCFWGFYPLILVVRENICNQTYFMISLLLYKMFGCDLSNMNVLIKKKLFVSYNFYVFALFIIVFLTSIAF